MDNEFVKRLLQVSMCLDSIKEAVQGMSREVKGSMLENYLQHVITEIDEQASSGRRITNRLIKSLQESD